MGEQNHSTHGQNRLSYLKRKHPKREREKKKERKETKERKKDDLRG